MNYTNILLPETKYHCFCLSLAMYTQNNAKPTNLNRKCMHADLWQKKFIENAWNGSFENDMVEGLGGDQVLVSGKSCGITID